MRKPGAASIHLCGPARGRDAQSVWRSLGCSRCGPSTARSLTCIKFPGPCPLMGRTHRAPPERNAEKLRVPKLTRIRWGTTSAVAWIESPAHSRLMLHRTTNKLSCRRSARRQQVSWRILNPSRVRHQCIVGRSTRSSARPSILDTSRRLSRLCRRPFVAVRWIACRTASAAAAGRPRRVA